MKYRGSLVICQFAKSRIFEQANRQMKKAMPCKWWEKYFRSPSLYLRHWSHTDLERYIYLKLAASIGLLLTKSHGYLIGYKLNILHPHVNVLYCKSNFLISIQYIKHRWKMGHICRVKQSKHCVTIWLWDAGICVALNERNE